MDTALLYELIGYLASVLVVISLMMSRLLWLRVVNLAGALTFTLYGVLIGALPVALTNGAIVIIDLVYLWRMTRPRDYYALLEVDRGSSYLHSFLDFHRREIDRFLPDFSYEPRVRQLRLFVLRDMVPTGLFIAEPAADGTYEVRLDFVIPGYRDYRIGRYLFRERADFFRERGVRAFESRPGTRTHELYLRRMGFEPLGDGGRYRRELG